HRGMDTVGAIAGPCLALLFLLYYPGRYQLLFFLAFIPGILAIGLTVFIREKKAKPKATSSRPPFFSFVRYFKEAPPAYRKLVAGLVGFALINSSDVFLLLKCSEILDNDTAVIGIYIFYNFVYALAAYPAGMLADRIGIRRVFISGLFLFAIAYGIVGFGTTLPWFLLAFVCYGLYAAATEGLAKAWISNIATREQTATAIGSFASLQSLAVLIASSFTGLVWHQFGSAPAIMVSAGGALVTACYFMFLKMDNESSS
ncbi:MAG: MFS transporter, partial [Sphingobacteriales bacterium]